MGDFALPVDEDDITILGIMASLEIAAANEFSQYLDSRFRAQGELNWFENIQHYRRSINSPFNYLAPNDLRFVLGEATLPDSQIWHLIPNINQMWVNAADGLRKKLNQLHHQQLKPDLNTLYQIASLFDAVTAGPGLDVSSWARALKGRVQDIRSGRFRKPADQGMPSSVPPEVAEIEKEYQEVKKDVEKRPPWGGKWTGPKPARKLTLDRHTRDIYDSNGVSVKGELGELGDQVIAIWLRYFPLGGEVWVDSDGATMAYQKGLAKMIGWFGPAPDENSEVVRGFVLPREYEFVENDIVELETGLKLSAISGDSFKQVFDLLTPELEPGSKLNITDYGDLFIPVSEGAPRRLSRMHKGIWFPGHLPE
jgi:hypothetical protein